MVRSTRLAPLLGIPAITLPLPSIGPSVGLQLIARPRCDDALLDIAAAIEKVLAALPTERVETC
jgi:Asp-tRNA(Asn)/Glu-tRNA(Gln) amidotransferase A subunit family amidase